jgi:hypothetical protein
VRSIIGDDIGGDEDPGASNAGTGCQTGRNSAMKSSRASPAMLSSKEKVIVGTPTSAKACSQFSPGKPGEMVREILNTKPDTNSTTKPIPRLNTEATTGSGNYASMILEAVSSASTGEMQVPNAEGQLPRISAKKSGKTLTLRENTLMNIFAQAARRFPTSNK